MSICVFACANTVNDYLLNISIRKCDIQLYIILCFMNSVARNISLQSDRSEAEIRLLAPKQCSHGKIRNINLALKCIGFCFFQKWSVQMDIWKL